MIRGSRWIMVVTVLVCMLGFAALPAAVQAETRLPYTIVDTGQDRCYDNTREIPYPKAGAAFFGQDAQYRGVAAAYKDNGDGTVADLNTGLMWVAKPDTRHKVTYNQAMAGAKTCRVGGYGDWRLPTVKELYSLIDFRGYSARTEDQSRPYIDTRYFGFAYGDASVGDRLIDSQYVSSNMYVGTAGKNLGGKVFGVNFADGRIKGYDLAPRGRSKTFVAQYVRGNPSYGKNDFHDNGDGTVIDRATGLTWMKGDSGTAMPWQDALAYAAGLKLAGHDDWRLPSAKELQSLVDYSRAPDAADAARRGPAIDPVFLVSETESWYWTGTTHLDNRMCENAVYVAFGQAQGFMNGSWIDIHGAGAQRSDPKSGNPSNFKNGRGPQGDEIRIYNYVRCVRGGDNRLRTSGPPLDDSFVTRPSSVPRVDGSGAGPSGGFVARLDKNGDGKVSRDEFDGPQEHFETLDRNHDGYLTEDEAPQGPPPGRGPGRMGQ